MTKSEWVWYRASWRGGCFKWVRMALPLGECRG
jgi:hypothetical protein